MESANVVGYVSTANVQAGKFYLIAQHFQNTTGGSVDIQNFITSSDMQGGTDDDNSPNLKLWDGVGYDDYYFYSEDLFGEQNCWGQGSMKMDGIPVDLAKGAFLKTINNCTISVAGQVASADSMNVPLTANVFNLVANPYPISFNINGTKVKWADALVGGTDDDNSPNLKIWDGAGYDDYYFYSEDLFGDENCWGQGQMSLDTTIDPGHGFWLKYTNNASDVNLTFEM